MNDIGVATLNLLRPIALDAYGEIRGTGAFILVDAETNGTVAAGMMRTAHGLAASGRAVARGYVGAGDGGRKRGAVGTSRRCSGTDGAEGTDRCNRAIAV